MRVVRWPMGNGRLGVFVSLRLLSLFRFTTLFCRRRTLTVGSLISHLLVCRVSRFGWSTKRFNKLKQVR